MIYTRSSFYYGHKINASTYNGYLNIDEGSGPITIELPVGSFTLTEFIVTIRNALLTQATLNYSVTTDRETRRITISADSNFDLLIASGDQFASAAWDVMGFTSDTDLTGQMSYTGSSSSGKEYCPQFLLQNYVAPEIYQEKHLASKNVAADGKTIEVIKFGDAQFIEMDIKYITSKDQALDGYWGRLNPTGLEDAIDFMLAITNIDPFEFNPDFNNPSLYHSVILESTPQYSDGTGFKLKEMFSVSLNDIYETGLLRLRVID